MNLLRTLFDFRGRINRAKFWLTMLIWFVVFMLAGAIGAAVDSMDTAFYFALLTCIPMTVSGIAVGIKRLHDRNKSAWWLIVFFALPLLLSFLNPLVAGVDSLWIVSAILQIVGFAVSIWALVELGVLRGTIGDNPYGHDPIAPKPAQH